LAVAVDAQQERTALAVLVGLKGVLVPVASAILTTIAPDRYTVLDFRALESLGCASQDRSIDFYLGYLEACRGLASRHDMSLRNFDRALWQWSSIQAREG
jgi:hypothetical protein